MKKNKKDHTPLALKIVRWAYPKVERIAPALAHRYFLNVFFSPLKYPVPEKEKKAQSFAGNFSVEAAGKRIQGYAWGEAAPYVLLVHGWAGRSTQFRRFIKPLLAAGYSVIGFDAPAHGNSEGRKTSILEFEETLKKIYELKGEPIAILAHSFGGGATLFAAMNGLPVRKLVNIASPTIGDVIIDTYLRAINGSPASGDFLKRYMLEHFGKPFDAYTAMHFVKHLPKPIDLLLVHDEGDREAPIVHAEELLKAYPSAKLIRTKGLGHTRILKDDEVIRACVTFIGEGTSAL